MLKWGAWKEKLLKDFPFFCALSLFGDLFNCTVGHLVQRPNPQWKHIWSSDGSELHQYPKFHSDVADFAAKILKPRRKIQISPLFLYFLPRIFLTVWSNCCGRIQANLHRAFKYNSSQLHHLRRDSFSWQFYPSEIKDKLCTIIPLWLCTYFPFILCIGIAGPFSVFFPPSIFVLSSVYIWLWRKQFSQQLLYKQSKINIYSVTQIGRTKEEQKKNLPAHTQT